LPTSDTKAENQALGEYRAYLETLTFIQVGPRLRQEFDLSDIIQITLLEAYRDRDRIPRDELGRKRWLRKMFVNNLLDEIKKIRRRPVKVSLEQLLKDAEESSCRLQGWLEAEDTPPGKRVAKQEEALRLLDALAKLDPRRRDALILQKYHGWTLAQIAKHLDCTSGAVAGLLRRGLKELRELVPDME
jgi:RNA polymerase sigma-70 factor (ECF subfamily)